MASLKVYAPDLGLRTAFITLVQFFASAAAFWSFVLIAVFAAFAIIENWYDDELIGLFAEEAEQVSYSTFQPIT